MNIDFHSTLSWDSIDGRNLMQKKSDPKSHFRRNRYNYSGLEEHPHTIFSPVSAQVRACITFEAAEDGTAIGMCTYQK